jgi:3-oxoacyl-[acyl-carrier-protein] synthase-3
VIRSRIIGTGKALGSERIENKTLSISVGLSPVEIEKRTGIQCRYWASEKETTADLAARAAEEALRRAGRRPEEVGLIVLSTTSPDFPFPATACLVQDRLSARRAHAFDLNASCSGFLYALSIADHAIRSETVVSALVIAAEIKSRFLKRDDFSTAILFGDGAGAVLLERSEERSGIEAVSLHADGRGHALVRLPAGGSRQPISPRTLANREHTIEMNGSALYRAAVARLGETLEELASSGWSSEKIDWYVFHQANGRILKTAARRNRIPMRKVIVTLADFGNTSSSSIPIALEVGSNGRFRPGERIALVSFGGGLTWGSARLVW